MTNNNRIISRIIAVIMLIIFFVSLIPIIIASFYSHPVQDDFGYSYLVHEAINNNGALDKVIKAAFQKTLDTYLTWQGTYAAVFIMTLQPGVFSQDYYFLTTLILLTALIVSTFCFTYTVLVKWLRCKSELFIILTTMLLFLQIQFMPDIKQGLYWFNGSSYYTLFYTFSLVFFSFVIRIQLSKKKIPIIYTMLSVFFAIIIGGGNYTTALVSTLLMLLIVLYAFFRKKQFKWILLFITVILVAAFLISALAPGNKVRAASSNGQNPIVAILKSFCYAFVYIGKWTRLPEIVFFVVSLPILFVASKNVNFKFRYPLVFVVLAFCLFAAQFTPSLYALSKVGGGRQINIYYYSFYWMILVQIFYVFGWINQKMGSKMIINSKTKLELSKYYIIPIVLSFLLFGIGCVGQINEMTTVETSFSILSRESENYDKAYNKIIDELEKPCDICYVDDSSLKSNIYPELQLSNDEKYCWTNEQLAEYFHHKKVIKIE